MWLLRRSRLRALTSLKAFPYRERAVRGRLGRFEDAFVELQQEFMFGFLGPFLTAVDLPLVAALNPAPQRNDLPDKILIEGGGGGRGGASRKGEGGAGG